MSAQQNNNEASQRQNNASIPLSERTQAAVDKSRTQRAVGGRFSRVLLFLLVVLALVASVLMLFTDSDTWTKVAVISALWAAGLGAFLVSRYASTLAAKEGQEHELEQRHRAELEREKAQFLQREAELRNEYSDATQRGRDEQLEALRAELAYLRKQLTEMTGQDYTDNSHRAVHARAERVHELGARVASTTATTATSANAATAAPKHGAAHSAEKKASNNTPKPAASASGSTGTPRPRAGDTLTTGSFAAVKWSGPDNGSGKHNEETTQIPLVVDHARGGDRPVQLTSTGEDAQKSASQHHGAHEAAHRASEQPAAKNPAPARNHSAAHIPSHAAGADNGAHRRGRRRADESQGGLTVAELLARSKRNDS